MPGLSSGLICRAAGSPAEADSGGAPSFSAQLWKRPRSVRKSSLDASLDSPPRPSMRPSICPCVFFYDGEHRESLNTTQLKVHVTHGSGSWRREHA